MNRSYSRAFAVITASMYFMFLAGCGGGDSGPTSPSPTPPTPTPPAPPPTPVATSITVAPSSHTLASIGATIQLTATVKDQNNNPMTGQTVTWTSANTAVATVSGNGLVTAVSNGTSQVTARSGNASGTASITVAEPVPTRIAVTPSSHTLEAIGATVQLTATVRDQRNNVMSGQSITWSSGDEAVATVSAAGLVTAVSNGTSQVTARSGNASGTASITVAEPVPTRIAVTPSSHTLEAKGETVELRATVRDQRNNVMSGQSITWSSGDEAVATVSAAGLVTAVRNGSVQITAQSGSLSSNAAITVAQAPAGILIAVDPDSTTLTEIDQTLQLTVVVIDANDFSVEDAAVSWSSSDESVATVDEDGLVTAVGNGMTEITATAGEASGMVSISVMGPSPDRETLIALYNATSGPIWRQQDNWLSEAPIRTWHGITTDEGDRVTKIELTDNLMTGPIPPELGQLARLDSLIFSRNSFHAPIPPELGQLERLEYLDLDFSDLTGSIPPELGQLERLEFLNLGTNDLTGPIPPELGQLERLEFLNLGTNDLTGPIPPELGQLASLERLLLFYSGLSGTIPPELGQLTNLTLLLLSGNNFTGNIPPVFGQLANLHTLDLAENQLSGSLPVELGQLASLRQLQLNGNNLTGNIPPELGQSEDLRFLHLGNNSDLSGSLPDSFLDLERLRELGLNGTQICVPPTADFQTWLSGIRDLDLEDITFCEPEYLPWTGVEVERGKLVFSASLGTIDLADCFTRNVLIGAVAPFPTEGLKDWNAPTGETLTVHYSLWQRSDDMGSTWTDIEATRVTYDACPYDPEVAGEYRLVGDITIDDERAFRRSENTFVIP